MKQKMSQKQLIALIKKSKTVSVYYSEKWKYPSTGDDPKTCPMLDVMLNVEQKGGFIIHIPDAKTFKKIAALTSKEVYG